MKYFGLLLVLMGHIALAQAPDIDWQKCLGGINADDAYEIQSTADGGYVLACSTGSYNGDVTGFHGGIDCWIVKLSSAGTLLWQKNIGGSNEDYAYSIKQTTDGGYIVAASTTSSNGDITVNNGSFDIWIVKLSSAGAIQWQKSFGGTNADLAYAIQQTDDGGYVVAGQTSSLNGDGLTNHGSTDVLILKLSSLGALEWEKCLGGTSFDHAQAIQKTTDGGFIIAGYSNSTNGDLVSNHGGEDVWVVKLSNLGLIQWKKTFGGSADDYANGIQQTGDGGYIVACNTTSNDGDVVGNHGNLDYWILKLSSAGDWQWGQTYGGANEDILSSILQTAEGDFIAVGSTLSTNGDVLANHGIDDIWVLKLSYTGTILSQQSLGGTNDEVGTTAQITSDGGFVIAGYTTSNNGDVSGNHGDVDAWVVKLTPDALATTSFTTHQIKVVPNPTTGILILLNGTNSVFDKITITDLTGKILLQQTQNTNQVNVESLVKGIYFLQTFAGNEKWTNKFVKE